jgi:hypothetical protein
MNRLENITIHLPNNINKLPVIELNEDFNFKGYIVPKGFRSDGASVPWFFRRWFPAIAAYTPAAIVHDLNCVMAETEVSYTVRRRGDKIFYSNCRHVLNRPLCECVFLYIGVTLGSVWALLRGRL